MRLLLVGARRFGLVFALILSCAGPARGSITFNWPNNGWTAGTPAAGQTKTQSFTSVNPNDITVAINNNGSSATGATFQNNYPQISRNPLTGGFGSTNALQLYLSSESSTSSYVRTTITFAAPVINLSFQLWDVDANPGQFIDQISHIQALSYFGGTVGADSVTSVTPGFNTISGTGVNIVVTGTANASNNANQGSIAITFNGPITQFSFDWSNIDPALGTQAIGIGPLTYSAIPESDSACSVAATCLIGILGNKMRRRANKLGIKN